MSYLSMSDLDALITEYDAAEEEMRAKGLLPPEEPAPPEKTHHGVYHEVAIEGTRVCRTCKQEKHVTAFHVIRVNREGRAYDCAECTSQIRASRSRLTASKP